MSVPPLYLEAPKMIFEGQYRSFFNQAVESSHGGVMLHGAAGTRKTTFGTKIMAAKMLGHIGEFAVDGLWTTAPELLANIRNTYNSKAKETELEVMRRYSEVGLLLIDDLGAEKKTDYSLATFYTILSNRINHMKFTIVTTNLNLETLHGWESRIASRLASFNVLEMTGRDHRL